MPDSRRLPQLAGLETIQSVVDLSEALSEACYARYRETGDVRWRTQGDIQNRAVRQSNTPEILAETHYINTLPGNGLLRPEEDPDE